jgi:hypothetical protein
MFRPVMLKLNEVEESDEVQKSDFVV